MMLMQILQLWEEAITSDSGLLWLVTLGFRYFVEVQEKSAAAFCLSNCPTERFEEYFEKSSQQQIEPSTVILGYTVLIPDWTWIGFRNADPSCEDERWSMGFWYYHIDYLAIVYRVIVWWVWSHVFFEWYWFMKCSDSHVPLCDSFVFPKCWIWRPPRLRLQKSHTCFRQYNLVLDAAAKSTLASVSVSYPAIMFC